MKKKITMTLRELYKTLPGKLGYSRKAISFFLCLITSSVLAQSYLPEAPKDTVIQYSAFTVGFSQHLQVPLWTAYEYQPKPSTHQRTECHFRVDRRFFCFKPTAYEGMGYDRGHLCPAEDFSWSEKTLCETFYMTNIAPQHPQLNRYKWKDLETQIRFWGKDTTDTLIVVTGVYFDVYQSLGTLVLPTHFYKIVYSRKNKCAIGFWMKNQKAPARLVDYVVTVDYLESVTGINFFAQFPDQSFESQLGGCFRWK